MSLFQTKLAVSIWVWSATPDNWPTVKSKKVWAVNTEGKGKRVLKGDKIVFYVKGTMHFCGAFQVKSDWHAPTIQWPNEAHVGDYISSEIDLEEIQLGFASVDKLLPSLRFVERTSRHVGVYLRGHPQGPANFAKPISEDDYNIILNELKQTQEEPSFRKNREISEFEDLAELPPQLHETAKIPPSAHKTPEEIFQDVQKGRCAVPNFQRYWTWNKKQIEELWESIFQGYYIGSLLIWPSSEQKLGKIPIAGGPKPSDNPDLILDGQQRITAIYYAVKSPNISLPNTEMPYKFFLDINALLDPTRDPSEIIISKSAKRAADNNLHDTKVQYRKKIFPLTLFQDRSYDRWLFSFYQYLKNEESYNDDEAQKYYTHLNKIFDYVWTRYQIPVVILPESLLLDNVATVFERINSKGTPLGIFDLLNARFIIYDIVLRDLWKDAKRRHDNIRKWYDEFNNDKLPLYIVQALALSKSGFLRRKQVLNLDGLYKVSESFDSKQFSRDWIEMSDYVEQAITRITSVTREGFGAVNYNFIPYTIMIPLIACMLKEIENKANRTSCLDKIRSWYWNSIIVDRYSGSTDSTIEYDYKIMKKWFDGGISEPFYVEERDSFRIKKKNSALYKAIMCVIAKNGALDFSRGDPPQYGSLQDHHIFPRSKAGEFNADEDIDLVLNRTLIFENTNKSFRDKNPSEYLTAIMNEQHMTKNKLQELLSTHLISPSAFECLLKDDFPGFIRAREQTIREKFKKLVHLGTVETSMDIKKLLKREDQYVEFKQTLRWDIKTNQINPVLGEVIMKEIACFMNADGGKIWIGVDDAGTPTGLDPDYQTFTKKNSGSFQEHLTNLVNKYLGKTANSCIDWSFHKIDGKEICLGAIRSSPHPIYIKTKNEKKFYVRNNNTCQPYDVEEAFDYISDHWS